MTKVSEVLDAVRLFGEKEIVELIDGLCPACALIPLDALLRLAASIAQSIEAKNELEAMRAAVKTADTTLDAAEEEALKAPEWP